MPIITRAIARGTAKAVGAEDTEELTADCIAQAARILHAGEANGKELPAKTVVYHALQRTKYGQRGPKKSISDVMAPRTQFLGRSTVIDMDAPLDAGGDDGQPEHRTLHDALAAPGEDVAAVAARRIDWEDAIKGMSGVDADILCSMADGRWAREVGEQHGMNVEEVGRRRRELRHHIRRHWDRRVIAEVMSEPLWKKARRTLRERRRCRMASAAA